MENKYVFTQIQPSEKNSVLKLIRTSFQEYRNSHSYFSSLDQSDEEIFQRVFSPNRLPFGIYLKDMKTLIGMCTIEYPSQAIYSPLLYGNGISLLEFLCVSPIHRKKNIGSLLLTRIKNYLKVNTTSWSLRWDCPNTACESILFYLKNGAKKISIEKYPAPHGMYVIFALSIKDTG